MMGHVNHASYFTYFETARTNYYLRLAGRTPPFEPTQLDLIVAKAACAYRRGLRWGERIEVVVWPTQVGRTSFTFRYLLLDEAERVAADGETVQVSYDYSGRTKKTISDALRRALEAERTAGSGVPDASD